MFRWASPVKSVLVVKKPEAARATAALVKLLPTLTSLDVTAYVEASVWSEVKEHSKRFMLKKFTPGDDCMVDVSPTCNAASCFSHARRSWEPLAVCLSMSTVLLFLVVLLTMSEALVCRTLDGIVG